MAKRTVKTAEMASLAKSVKAFAVMRGQLSAMHSRCITIAWLSGKHKVQQLRGEGQHPLGEGMMQLTAYLCALHDVLLHYTNECRRLAGEPDVLPSPIYTSSMDALSKQMAEMQERFKGLSREEIIQELDRMQ